MTGGCASCVDDDDGGKISISCRQASHMPVEVWGIQLLRKESPRPFILFIALSCCIGLSNEK